MPHHSSLQVRKVIHLDKKISLINQLDSSDGLGRTGTYIMIDMVLNKIIRGAKEIDLAATLEYLRDQRAGMIKNKVIIKNHFMKVIETFLTFAFFSITRINLNIHLELSPKKFRICLKL
jgi:hypothetical protein